MAGSTNFLTSSGHKGLTKALEKWPGCRLQRCTEHKRTNLLEHCPAHARRELRRDYNRIVYAKNGIDARKAYDELVGASAIKCCYAVFEC